MITSSLDFASPFQEDSLLEIRVSHMKKMPGLDVMSGIDKTICDMPMRISKLGLDGDEHDPTFHGGPDKAILGCKSVAILDDPIRHIWLTSLSRLLVALPQLAIFIP